MKANWTEAQAWAELVAAHWKRTGRNPTTEECKSMVLTAREMARAAVQTVN